MNQTDLEELFKSYSALNPNMDQEKTKELLRISGCVPKEVDLPVPHSFSEFLALSRTCSSMVPKEDLLYLFRAFNSNYLSRKNIQKYFMMGDKFSDEEMKLLLRMIPFDGTDSISINEFLDFLYEY